jgi:hypothetical protein
MEYILLYKYTSQGVIQAAQKFYLSLEKKNVNWWDPMLYQG